MNFFFDRQGEPITGEEWAASIPRDEETFEELRRVAWTDRDGIAVSTVWMGINHGDLLGRSPPLIFETMVFGGPLDLEQIRYATEVEALEGHEAMVAEVFG